MDTYVLELKKTIRTNYTKSSLYLQFHDNFKHVVLDMKEATKIKKGSLKKYYRIYGKENLIVHKIKKEVA